MIKLCSGCRQADLKRKMVTLTTTLVGKTYSARVPGFICDNCGADEVGDYELYAFELSVAKKLLDAPELLGQAFRYCRRTYGLSRHNYAHHNSIPPEEIRRLEENNATVGGRIRGPIMRSIDEAYNKLGYKPDISVA